MLSRVPKSQPPSEELEVMKLAAIGHKDDAIARRLGVSLITVRRRTQQFRERVGARNRTHAVAIGVYNGWLDPWCDPSR